MNGKMVKVSIAQQVANDLTKNGFEIIGIENRTQLTDAEISLKNGIDVTFTHNGFYVSKELPNGKFRIYPTRKTLKDIIEDIRKE